MLRWGRYANFTLKTIAVASAGIGNLFPQGGWPESVGCIQHTPAIATQPFTGADGTRCGHHMAVILFSGIGSQRTFCRDPACQNFKLSSVVNGKLAGADVSNIQKKKTELVAVYEKPDLVELRKNLVRSGKRGKRTI